MFDIFLSWEPVLRVRDVYPGSGFFQPNPGSRVDKMPDLRSGSTYKNSSILTQKPMLLKKWSGMFIPDLFFSHPWSGSQKSTGSRIRIRNTVENHAGLHGSGSGNKTESGPDTKHWCYELTHLDDDLGNFHVGLLGRHQVGLVASCKTIDASINNR